MRFMGSEEFKEYLHADQLLVETKYNNRLEVSRAYADIHPTRMAVNYATGDCYSESVNVVEYAIYLVDMKNYHSERVSYLTERAEQFKQAASSLTAEQQTILNEYKAGRITVHDHRLPGIFQQLRETLCSLPVIEREGVSC